MNGIRARLTTFYAATDGVILSGSEVLISDLVLLSRAHMRRIEPFFPRSRGLVRVDGQRVISGVIDLIRHGL